MDTTLEKTKRAPVKGESSKRLQDWMRHAEQKGAREEALEVYRRMLVAKYTDEKMAKMIRQNKGGNFHLSTRGHELIGVVCGMALTPQVDWSLPYYRDRSFAIGLGVCLVDIFAALLARDIPHHSGGRMMPDHFSHKELRIFCASSCVGSQFLQAVGIAKGISLREENEFVYVSAGEGATSQGDFHEALNFVSIHNLPVVFVIQDNGWAISVPVEEQTAGKCITKIAKGYENLLVQEVDGTDYVSCKKTVSKAVEKARKRQGPSLIVAKVARIGPHSSSDDPKKYKSEKHLEEDLSKDPLVSLRAYLLQEAFFLEQDLIALEEKTFQEVEKAAKLAEEKPFPKKESADQKVFKEEALDFSKEEQYLSDEPVVVMDALNHALKEEMQRDQSVLVFGQDVAHGKGGVFGITRGLTETFGEKRCFNTPLAESTIVGLAIGLSAASRFRPVAEIQFCDYSWTAMNQIINELASIHYRSNGEWNCPVVIRMPSGGYIQGGPYHSQSIEAYLCHTPGLKVVIPSNAEDAKRLLKTAIRDPNPVIFLEHKALYRQRAFCARKEPSEESLLPFGKANVVKEGTDLTIVAWSMMVSMATQVANELAKEGISVEVIDLRTLCPLDFEAIFASLQKTGKILIAQEAVKTGGFGAELAALIAEKGFTYLDAPVVRIGAKACPVPFNKALEDMILPQVEDLLKAARELYSF